MRIEGNVVHYLLAREFHDIECDKAARSVEVDYSVLYDETADMRGHAALIPAHERPHAGVMLQESLCVCMGEESAASAREAGFAVIHVRDDVTFARLYNYMQSVFVRFENLDVRLRTYIDARTGAQALLDACAETTGCAFALVDDEYRTVCQSAASASPAGARADAGELDMLGPDVVDLFMASRSYRHMRSNRNVFAMPGSSELLMKNLSSKGNLTGMLVSAHDGSALGARYTRFVLRYLSGYIERAHARLGSFGTGPTESDRIRAALAALLAEGPAGLAGVLELLAEDGRISAGPYAVLRIERSFTYEGDEEHDYLARRFEQAWQRAYCFTVDGVLFMLADIGRRTSPGAPDFLQDILIAARDNLAKVGMSRPFSSLDDIEAARAQATAALEQGVFADPTYWFYRFEDYALAWVLGHGTNGVDPAYVVHPAVIALARHDARTSGELLRTLSTFMRCRYNATRAAGELFVARSTLLNRLDRIVEMTGLDFDDADDLVYLAVSLKLVE